MYVLQFYAPQLQTEHSKISILWVMYRYIGTYILKMLKIQNKKNKAKNHEITYVALLKASNYFVENLVKTITL